MHGIIAVGTFVEAWINTPWEPITEEDDVPANDKGITTFKSVYFETSENEIRAHNAHKLEKNGLSLCS